MSEYYKEQHPLLCDEVSEEERYSPRYHRRLRASYCRGRARNSLKGAASIITHWPDHWSSFLTYWWIGLGMISLMTFIIYNCLFAFSILPSANLKPLDIIILNPNEKTSPKVALPDVYMHIFVDQYEGLDLNQYVPYIETISNVYLNFKYHLIIVSNDTYAEWLSAEENNQLALKSLLKNSPNKEAKPKSNIIIEYVYLTSYMDNSPLKKFWRALPNQLIEFLARAVAIWDKGGISFNPVILTPKSQHNLYSKKLQKLLNKYSNANTIVKEIKIMNKFNKTKKEKQLNNIRDIIDALENDNSINAFSQQTLTEAENIISPIITRSERHIITPTETVAKNGMERKSEMSNHVLIHSHMNIFPNDDSNTKESRRRTAMNISNTNLTKSLYVSHNTTKMRLLPLFLEFLFHNKLNDRPTEATIVNRTQRSVIDVLKPENKRSSLSTHPLDKVERNSVNAYKPVIVSAEGIYNKSEYDKTIIEAPSKQINEGMEKNQLTIDLRGNIIATDTPCHAFLGTIFSNAIRHSEEESVTDFIIAELTIFCKGLLSSCTGIDLILL